MGVHSQHLVKIGVGVMVVIAAIGLVWASLQFMALGPKEAARPSKPNGVHGAWKGRAAIDMARTMTVGRAYPVVLVVSGAKDFDLAALKEVMGVPDATDVREVLVADVMVARLSGHPLSAFEIKPERQDRKGMGSDGLIRWAWEITPKEAGSQRLLFELDALVRVEGAPDAPRTIHRQFITIDVAVVPWHEAVSDWAMRLATGEWLWSQIGTALLGLIGTALAAFVALRWQRIVVWWKRRNAPPPPLEK